MLVVGDLFPRKLFLRVGINFAASSWLPRPIVLQLFGFFCILVDGAPLGQVARLRMGEVREESSCESSRVVVGGVKAA